MNGLALCAGVGGLELALHIACPGYRTLCFVERDAHAAATLVARMEDQALDDAPIWDDVCSFDGRPWRGIVDLVSAGYPCQPFSTAGRRRGADDPRHLWPQIARIIGEARPRWVFLENVVGHLSLGFPEVGEELRAMGYRVAAGLFAAVEVGASHFRCRLFVLGHAHAGPQRQQHGHRRRRGVGSISSHAWPARTPEVAKPGGHGMDRPLHASPVRRLGAEPKEAIKTLPLFAPGPSDLEGWHRWLRRRPDLQPTVHRMAPGLADWVDRLSEAGNGVCPLAAAVAFRTLRSAIEAY